MKRIISITLLVFALVSCQHIQKSEGTEEYQRPLISEFNIGTSNHNSSEAYSKLIDVYKIKELESLVSETDAFKVVSINESNELILYFFEQEAGIDRNSILKAVVTYDIENETFQVQENIHTNVNFDYEVDKNLVREVEVGSYNNKPLIYKFHASGKYQNTQMLIYNDQVLLKADNVRDEYLEFQEVNGIQGIWFKGFHDLGFYTFENGQLIEHFFITPGSRFFRVNTIQGDLLAHAWRVYDDYIVYIDGSKHVELALDKREFPNEVYFVSDNRFVLFSMLPEKNSTAWTAKLRLYDFDGNQIDLYKTMNAPTMFTPEVVIDEGILLSFRWRRTPAIIDVRKDELSKTLIKLFDDDISVEDDFTTVYYNDEYIVLEKENFLKVVNREYVLAQYHKALEE